MSDDNIINCEEALKRLFEYIDNELHDHAHGEMDEHMSRCRSCFSRLEFEKHLRQHLQKETQQKTPDELKCRLKNMISKL